MNCKEVPNEDESLEEMKFRAIFLKINEKKFLSEQIYLSFADEIDMEDVTHYTVEARRIALKWKEEEREK